MTNSLLPMGDWSDFFLEFVWTDWIWPKIATWWFGESWVGFPCLCPFSIRQTEECHHIFSLGWSIHFWWRWHCRQAQWVSSYSHGQPKSTNLVIMIWGPYTTLNSTFYCRNVKIRTQCFNFHEPIFQHWWNEKFYPKNIGWPWNVPLNSWKIVQSTPFSILHLILEFGTNLMSRSCRKKWFYTT